MLLHQASNLSTYEAVTGFNTMVPNEHVEAPVADVAEQSRIAQFGHNVVAFAGVTADIVKRAARRPRHLAMILGSAASLAGGSEALAQDAPASGSSVHEQAMKQNADICDIQGTQGVSGVRGSYKKGSNKLFKVAFNVTDYQTCDTDTGDMLDYGDKTITYFQEVKRPGSKIFKRSSPEVKLRDGRADVVIEFVNSKACDTKAERDGKTVVRPVVRVKWDSFNGKDSTKDYQGKVLTCKGKTK